MAIKTVARQSSKPSAPERKTKTSKVMPTVVVVLTGSTASSRKKSANALATSLKKELLKVDVSVLLSRYVEETATNLGYLFDKAKAAGAILLFDEVDALFGSRTEVNDKFNDRYVNMAVDYLLQRIESYEGMVMITSNLPRSVELAISGLAQVTVLVEAAGSGKKKKGDGE